MPVIKSISYKSRSFGQLIDYMHRADSHGLLDYMHRQGSSAIDFSYLHNIFGVEADDLKGIETAFRNNDTFRKDRKNGNQVYQDIISFHAKDREYLLEHPEALWEIAELYLDKRAPNSLATARVHTDRDHIHVHMMISGNEVESAKATHLSQGKFAEVKQVIEEYQRTFHPQLEASQVKHGDRTKQQLKQTMVKEIKEVLGKATDRVSFLASLKAKGYEIYERAGKPTGIVLEGRKSRFTTFLGLKHDQDLKAQFETVMAQESEPVLSPLQYSPNELRTIRWKARQRLFNERSKSKEQKKDRGVSDRSKAWEAFFLKTEPGKEKSESPENSLADTNRYNELTDIRNRSRSDDDLEREIDD